MLNILVIDDDREICNRLSNFLSKNNYFVNTANTGEEGCNQVRSNTYDLILCDYKLPDISGVDLLKKLKILQSAAAIILVTGYSDIKIAVDAFRSGANDYLTKPFFPDELLITIKKTIEKNKGKILKLVDAQSEDKDEKVKSLSTHKPYLIGISEASKHVQSNIKLIAPSDMSVIITGETGTGKEYVAQSIHQLSKRSREPFIAIDCGALPKELAGSELFGHTKGSFTGAIADKPGSFELASGGTIFLDEIGNLSYENQVKLLRVIQERKIKRIGATKDSTIDVRIIVATNENLLAAIHEHTFREDLYYRLNEFTIELSPLRNRQDDILYYADFFLDQANHSLKKNVTGFSEDVKDYLQTHAWPGNLRQLKNTIKRAVLLATDETIRYEHLPIDSIPDVFIVKPDEDEDEAEPASSTNSLGLLRSASGAAERQAIIDALKKLNHNKSRAARYLKIDRKTLYNKLKLYKIDM